MKYSFKAFGHKNILATHKTTLEITKDKEVTRKGDCIIGVGADYSLKSIKDILKDNNKIILIIEAGNVREEISAKINHSFNCENEIVLRKTNFISERTLGIDASKSSFEIKRDLIKKIGNPENEISIILETLR